MKKLFIVVVVSLAASICGAADESLWFPIGEVLHYRMQWSFVSIGESRIETGEVETGGKTLISIRYHVRTTGIFNKIYPVKDFIEVLIDPDGFIPVLYTKRIERRTPGCNETVVFDRKLGEANWYSQCLNEHGTFGIEDDTRDIISLLYLMRKEPMNENTESTNKVVVTRSVTEMIIKVGKLKKMDVAGRDDVDCFPVNPVAKLDDLLVDEGEVKAWVSADKRRIVTRLDIDAAFGTVKALLHKVEGPGDDVWVAKEKK